MAAAPRPAISLCTGHRALRLDLRRPAPAIVKARSSEARRKVADMAQIEARRQALEQRISEALKQRDKERQAEAMKTARLKELRLAKEAAERDAAHPGARRSKAKAAAGH